MDDRFGNVLVRISKFENLFLQLHSMLLGLQSDRRASIEWVSIRGKLSLYFYIPVALESSFKSLVFSLFPDVNIIEEKNYEGLESVGGNFAVSEITLEAQELYSIRTYKSSESVDQMSSFFNLIASTPMSEAVLFQTIVEPIDEKVESGEKGIIYYQTEKKEAIEEKQKFYVSSRMVYFSEQKELNPMLSQFEPAFSEFASDRNKIVILSPSYEKKNLVAYFSRARAKTRCIFNREELASFVHIPDASSKTPGFDWILSRKSEPPVNLPTSSNTKIDELCLFGATNFRDSRVPFGIKREDRRRHLYTVGKSGTGKSKMLENLIISDINSGKGVCVIDPHGDLIQNSLKRIPKERIDDVVYFNPSDMDFPIAFNPLENISKEYKQQVAQGLIEVFKKSFGADWTPKIEHVFRFTVLALLDYKKATIADIMKVLTDRSFRQDVISKIEDSVVKNFWANEFSSWSEKFDNEAIIPLLNKLGQFLSIELVRNIVGQPKNLINLNDILNNQKILFIELSKGKLGEENISLLGSMILTKIQQAIMARAYMKEEDRKDFYLYVDEFQYFATSTFSDILAESRKYKLSLTLSHQYLGQLSPEIKQTVFGNVGSFIVFRVGAEDASFLEKELQPTFSANDIINLGVREVYVKMSIAGETTRPFSARTMDVPSEPADNSVDEIIKRSRAKYANSLDKVKKEYDASIAFTQDDEFEKPVV